jgi:hypothetical protein
MKTKIALTILATSMLVAACGGGGGGSPAEPVSDLQTSVPAATYGTGSAASLFFTALNDFRAKLGLGLLQQNTKLDLAAANHLTYVTTHSTLNGGSVDMAAIDPTYNRPRFHIEESAKAGFTGAQEKDRATYAGYDAAYIGELGTYGQGAGSIAGLNSVINTVFHRFGLMTQGVREVGIAAAADPAQTIVVEMAYASTPQKNASDFLGFYPGANQTGVPLFAGVETPNPFSDISYADYSTKTSAPINVVSAEHTTLAVTSFTVTESGQPTPLDARLLVKSTDANTTMLFGSNVAFLVAKTAFKPNTVYNVSFTGTINGAATSKTWSFTSGS